MLPLEDNPLYSPTYTLLNHVVSVCKSGVFIDAGANIGGMICSAGDMDVHAFEPVPDVFEKLVEAHSKRPNTYLNHLGLSDRNETLNNVTVNNAWTIGDPEQLGLAVCTEYANQRFHVNLITLDSYMEQHKLTLGVFKLDVDGYEHRVLRGAAATLLRDRPPIYMEASYLIRNISGRIDEFITYTIKDLNYTWFSNDGSYRTNDLDKILRYYPWTTSFDVTLLPTENFKVWLP